MGGIATLATLAVVATLPGLVLGWAMRLRGWLLAATAPLLTYGIVGAAAPTAPALGLRWSPLVLAGATAVLALAALLGTALTRLLLRRRPAAAGADLPPWGPAHHVGAAGAAALAGLIGVAVCYRATAGFTAVPQIWDSIWHANATLYIAQTGQSHPAALRGLNEAATSAFYYPNAYHVLAATVVMLGAPVITVLDASVGLAPLLLAPGLVALVRHNGGSPALAAAAALLSSAVTSFPYDLLPWGTLLPFLTAVALLPGFLALLAAALSHGAGASPPAGSHGAGASPPAGSHGAGGSPPAGSQGAGASPPAGSHGAGAFPPANAHDAGPFPPEGTDDAGASPPEGAHDAGPFPPDGSHDAGPLPPARSRGAGAFPLALAGLGLLALHPSVVVAAAVYAAAYLIALWWRRRPGLADLRVLAAAALLAVLLGGPLLLASVRATQYPPTDWPAVLRPADALGEVLFFAHGQQFPQYWLAGLAVLGLLRRAPLRPLLWFVVAGGVFVALFVAAASYEGDLVAALTRPWWNDRWRFAALWSLPAMVLAAAGLVTVRDAVWRAAVRPLTSRRPPTGQTRLLLSAVVSLLVVSLLVVATEGLYAERDQARLAQAYTDGPTVSREERRAYQVLAMLVPPGQLVMNDAYDGSPLMWTLAGVRPVFASPVIERQELPTMDPDRKVLFLGFDRLDTDPTVRQVVTRLGIHYVLVGTGYVGPATGPIPGMRHVDDVRSLRLVYRNRDARIYEIGDSPGPAAGTSPAGGG